MGHSDLERQRRIMDAKCTCEGFTTASCPVHPDGMFAEYTMYADEKPKNWSGVSGAQRSVKALPFWQFPLSAMKAFARRILCGAEGPSHYAIHNWKQGASDVPFIRQTLNHLMEHTAKLAAGSPQVAEGDDDKQGNLDAMLANIVFLIEYNDRDPKAFNDAFYGEHRGEKGV